MRSRSAVCSLAQVRAFGELVGQQLQMLDLVLLRGPIGAGKSTVARSIVRSAVQDPEVVVPSPTFLLAIPYESPRRTLRNVLHVDLHRMYASSLEGTDEMPGFFSSDGERPETILTEKDIEPLGWHDAIAKGAVLCEWPHGLGRDAIWGHTFVTPRNPVLLTIEPAAEAAGAGDDAIAGAGAGSLAAARPAVSGVAAAAAAARGLADDTPRRLTLHWSGGRWDGVADALAPPVR